MALMQTPGDEGRTTVATGDLGIARESAAVPWLLLVHQLPARPVSVRVKIWRRLQRLGAVAVKNSVYTLPNRPEAREDFEWVRAEIAASGGQATVFQAATIDSVSSDDLRDAFRRERQKEYRRLTQLVEKATRTAAALRRRDPRALAKTVRAWRARLVEIEALDYFSAAGRDEARAAIARLESVAAPAEAATAASVGSPTLDPADYGGRRWRTRPRPGIDRMACAWLIRRFIDAKAVFEFGDADTSGQPDTVTFDMFEGHFTHDGDRCTFEVMCDRFALTDARLKGIAELVHDLDLKDERFGRAEAPVLGAVVEGLRVLHDDDQTLLDQGVHLFEALYQGQIAPPVPARRPRVKQTARTAGRARGR